MYEKDRNGDSVLKNALGHNRNSLEILKLFIEKGADVHAKDENGDTALHIAAIFNKVEVTKFLLQIPGIKVYLYNKNRETPLFCAVAACCCSRNSNTDPELVKLLLKAGANIRKKNTLDQHPLHLAACYCVPSIIKLLLDYGALVNVLDKEKRSPLWIAVAWCEVFHRDAIKILLDAGALVFEDHPMKKYYPDNDCPFNQNSSLHIAAKRYMYEKETYGAQASAFRMERVRLLLQYALLENPCLSYQYLRVDEATRQALRDFGSLCLQELQMVCVPPNVSLAQFILRSRFREEEESLTEEILEILSANSYPIYTEVVLGLMDRNELKEWFQQHSVTTVSQKNAEERESLDYDTLCELMIYLWDEDLLNLMLAIYNPKTIAPPVDCSASNVDSLDEIVAESRRFFKRARIN